MNNPNLQKINSFLKLRNPDLATGRQFSGWVIKHYNELREKERFENSNNHQKNTTNSTNINNNNNQNISNNSSKHLPSPEWIIDTTFSNIDQLTSFIMIIKQSYLKSCGNHSIFRRSLLNNGGTIPYLLFNCLIHYPTPASSIVTFSSWDNIVIQFILAWCIVKNHGIKLSTLFLLVDKINNDCPYQLLPQ